MRRLGTLIQVVRHAVESHKIMPDPQKITHFKKLDLAAFEKQVEKQLKLIDKKLEDRQLFQAKDELSKLELLYLENHKVQSIDQAWVRESSREFEA